METRPVLDLERTSYIPQRQLKAMKVVKRKKAVNQIRPQLLRISIIPKFTYFKTYIETKGNCFAIVDAIEQN